MRARTANDRPTRTSTPPAAADDDVGDAGVKLLTGRVAENVRKQRMLRDLSLDALSSLTGVSRAALSQIETRRTNPTLGVLWKISSGLRLPFSELIGEGHSATSVVRREGAQFLWSLDNKVRSRPLMPPAGLSQMEVYELLLSARSRHVSEAHGAGTRELVVVLTGSLRMLVGTRVDNLGPGDSVVFNADVPHVYENPDATEALYHDIIVYPR